MSAQLFNDFLWTSATARIPRTTTSNLPFCREQHLRCYVKKLTTYFQQFLAMIVLQLEIQDIWEI